MPSAYLTRRSIYRIPIEPRKPSRMLDVSRDDRLMPMQMTKRRTYP